MYRTLINFHNRIIRGENPAVFCLIQTDYGYRAYSDKELIKYFELEGHIADGSVTAAGSETAGVGLGLIEKSARVLSFGSFERTIQPKMRDVLGGIEQRQLQHVSVSLNNEDRHFSKILPKEPFLGKPLYIYAGFEADAFHEYIKLFEGAISEVRCGKQAVIEADEKAILEGYFWLNRAGRYTNPLNTNDRLPVVYGDLTDGSSGNWISPCINTVSFVYCFADHEVLTVANGNSINIYADHVLVNPANYTFSASNNYGGLGTIATITFTTDQGNAQISVRGKGKNTGASLITNIVDIIYDFLTVENSYAATLFDSTAKAMSSAKFTANSYAAAGVIEEDDRIWDIVQRMIGSFYGTTYINGPGLLVLDIDDGTISQYAQAGIIPKTELTLSNEPKQELQNLINQCPTSYAYNYVSSEFRSHTDDSAHANLVSQGIYGLQEPAWPFQCYWCRNLANVQAIQDIIVGKFAYPVWLVEISDKTLKRSSVDVGDLVIITIDCLYDTDGNELTNELFRVVGVKPNFSRGQIGFRLLDTGYPLTIAYLAEGTYTADGSIRAGGNRDTTVY